MPGALYVEPPVTPAGFSRPLLLRLYGALEGLAVVSRIPIMLPGYPALGRVALLVPRTWIVVVGANRTSDWIVGDSCKGQRGRVWGARQIENILVGTPSRWYRCGRLDDSDQEGFGCIGSV